MARDLKRQRIGMDWQKSAVWSVPVVDMEHGSCCQKHLVHAMLRSQDSRDPPQAVLGIQYVTVHIVDHRFLEAIQWTIRYEYFYPVRPVRIARRRKSVASSPPRRN